jgi:hypothetical protein
MTVPPHDNQSEFVVHPHLVLTKDGEVLQCIVKGTFEWNADVGQLRFAPPERQRQVRFVDVPWGEPDKSSVAYPADVAPGKVGTDVIVVAKAYPPPGASEFDAFARVGTVRKALKIFGLRVWQEQGRGLSSPRSATPVEVRYDFAWGGIDDSDPKQFVEEARNPVGMGVARDPHRLTHQVAPCIEDPEHPISTGKTYPPPAGLGPIGRHWEPRRRYAGTYDKLWKEFRSPLPPPDQDDRFHQSATPDLVAVPALRGGEDCGFLNLTPGVAALQFALPKIGAHIEFHIEGRAPAIVRPTLDTVLIDLYFMEQGFPATVELVWRASVPAPRKLGRSLTVVKEWEWI